MFYCDPCRKKRDWPNSLMQSRGRCELCEETALCWDRPSSSLPMPKMTPEKEASLNDFFDSMERGAKYFLAPTDTEDWEEVSMEEFVKAERRAGFWNTGGRSDRPATAGFSSTTSPVHGKVEYPTPTNS